MKKHSILLGTLLCLSQLISAQVYPLRPKLSHERSFSMVLIPDPQSYVKFDANQPLFELQTAWIANSLKSLNIKGVLCTGDLVEQNEIRIPDGVNGNQTSEEQWKAASRAFERLDGKVPYVICTGNHQGIPTLENAAYEFETDTWGKLLVVSLEFAPRDEAIEWARQLTGKPKYKNHKVILLTHSYMSPEAVRHVKEDYKVSPANYGQAIWDKLVSQMMFNAQTADGQWHGNGGDCWLRLMEFLPDGKTISVRTFSPLFALSPTTFDKAWRTAPYDQFKITIE